MLFSDGYDNKGCAPPGSTRPSALQAAQALPADVRLFSCAMGPASDQALLESLATATSGRYYFMPAIDELFEIYNYIRGQVSGTSIVVNQAGQASTSSVPAFIDAAARAATFTVAWTDAGLRAVPGDPQKPHEVGVRLVDPRGRTVPEHASFVRRHVADTFVVFRIEDPAPGRWHLQVKTHGADPRHLHGRRVRRFAAAAGARRRIRVASRSATSCRSVRSCSMERRRSTRAGRR